MLLPGPAGGLLSTRAGPPPREERCSLESAPTRSAATLRQHAFSCRLLPLTNAGTEDHPRSWMRSSCCPGNSSLWFRALPLRDGAVFDSLETAQGSSATHHGAVSGRPPLPKPWGSLDTKVPVCETLQRGRRSGCRIGSVDLKSQPETGNVYPKGTLKRGRFPHDRTV